MAITVGKLAPDFNVADETGNVVNLKALQGKKTVLYFYPKDSTPGCTIESCGFRDAIKKFEKLNTQVIGVSKDNVKSHIKFKEKHELNFPLLADEDASLCQAFGVLVDKSMFGKKYKGIERSTFLLDENGKVQHIWRKVNIIGHVSDVLKKISEIQG
ncbi:MAG TPA: thioredoxin-dependent thiol peroxidase [Gammaproteobacteria bacterium]|nr:thioredoxin-dependent thiol peroxidase [Gammaproteobacteria bacterium]